MLVYGVPVGSDPYVHYMLKVKIEEVTRQAERVQEVLAGESQAMWSILQLSLAQKLDWHLSLCYPSDILTAA